MNNEKPKVETAKTRREGKLQTAEQIPVTEMKAGLDQDLVSFLEARVRTVEHLEVLLLMSSSPEEWWSAREVNDLLRSREDSIASRLAELWEQGLLDKESTLEKYRLKQEPGLNELLKRLGNAYKMFRVRVIHTIYAPKCPPSKEVAARA